MKIQSKIFFILLLSISMIIAILYKHYLNQKKDYNEFIDYSISSSINKIQFDIEKIDKIINKTVKYKYTLYKSLHENILKQLQKNNNLDLNILKKSLDEKFPSNLITTQLYLINSDYMIYDTTHKQDLNLNFSNFLGAKEYIDNARKNPNKVLIADPSFDILNKTYQIYSYALLDSDKKTVLEISFFDKIASQIKDSMYQFNLKDSIVKEVELFSNYGKYIINLTKHEEIENISKQEFIEQRINTKDREYLIVKEVSQNNKTYSYNITEDDKVFKISYTNIPTKSYISKTEVKSYVLKTKLDISEFENKLEGLAFNFYITLLIFLLYIYLLYIFLSNFFTKPIQKILYNMDFWIKIEDKDILNKGDELSQLAKSFNETFEKQTKITQELNEQFSIINTVLNAMDDLIFYKNYQTQNGNYIGCNDAYTKFIGKDYEEIIHHNDLDLFEEELAIHFQNNDRKVMESKEPMSNKCWLVYPDKSKIYVHTLIAPILNSDGTILGVIGISRDITEESEYQANLEKLNQTLKYKVKEEVDKNRFKDKQLFAQSRLAQMGEMISMIAHQWRQPLAAIASTTANLETKIHLEYFDLSTRKDQVKQNAYFIERLEAIGRYVINLTTTIDDFRNFYKPNKNIVIRRFKDISQTALEIMKASLESAGIELVFDYQSKQEIEMYDSEMIQVILNILKNAQDNFNEKKTKDPRIKIVTKNKSLIITDNGGGIEEKIMEKIFDPYFSTKDEKNGTGLGLYMSKIIVEEHHKGTLKVENIDAGVCFSVNLNGGKIGND